MGETTGASHRRTLAAAGVPAFPSPEQAVQGFHHLLRDREARAAARELPPSDVLELRPDAAALARLVDGVRAAGRTELTPDETAALLAIYGITAPATLVSLSDDPMFGPAIGLGFRPPGERAYDLPPLNLPLAHALAERAGCGSDEAAMADLLVRVSQLVVDCPALAALTLAPDGTATAVLHPPGQRSLPAIAPYPAELVETWEAAGETLTIRPIRPEDAAAHRALFDRVDMEDKRMRFFSAVRDVSAERIARMTQVDYDREMAFVAKRADGDTAGGSRLVRDGDVGEFAILVEPAMKGTGLARHLMDRIIAWGRDQGMVAIVGQVLIENRPMLAFVRRIGFTVRHSPDDPDVAEVRLDLTPPE
jgi:acetyltransferase